MPQYYEYELAKAAHKLVSEMLKLKPNETLVVTADTESDPRIVDATAAAAFAIGAKPMVVWIASPLGVGKAADPMLPEALGDALCKADAWVEYNNQWIFYSSLYERVMETNKKIRHCCYVGMNVDMMVRVIGRVDLPTLDKYMTRLHALTKAAKHVKMTTPAGGNVEFENDPNRIYTKSVGYADTPGESFMLGGQIGWAPIHETINGVIVFDGSINPPLGLVKEPVKLHVKASKIEKIEGGQDARAYEAWLKNFNHPGMLRVVHVCYGCNPGAKLTGNVVEDERVWGCTEWGLGYLGTLLTGGKPLDAPSHSDGICLNTSVWLDGKQIWDQGRAVDPELAELAKKLGKA
ncbi:MAG: aminopeptidase [Candidatus Bathyarchaeia archaeon]